MGQLNWPEKANVSRYSIPQHDDHYRASPKMSLRRAYVNSTTIHSNKPNCKLIEIVENNDSSLKDIKYVYDGLITLDETRLDEMIETDLVSSSNG